MGDAAEQPAPDAAMLIFKVKLAVLGERNARDTQLLFRLATRALKQRFARLHYAACGGVEHARHKVFDIGATLHQDFAHTIMHHDIGRAVTQTFGAHLRPAGLRYHLIVFTDNVHPFHVCQMILLHHQETFCNKRSYGAFWLFGKLRGNRDLCNNLRGFQGNDAQRIAIEEPVACRMPAFRHTD